MSEQRISIMAWLRPDTVVERVNQAVRLGEISILCETPEDAFRAARAFQAMGEKMIAAEVAKNQLSVV